RSPRAADAFSGWPSTDSQVREVVVMKARSQTLLICVMLLVTGSVAAAGTVTKKPFGQTRDGKPVELYTLTNSHGMRAAVMTYGGILVELTAPDRMGQYANVVLGFDTLEPYLGGHPLFGALVGRYANRIG